MPSRKVQFISFFLFGILASPAFAQWVTIPTGTTGAYESIYFFDALTGVASSSNKVLKTSDAGTSWTQVSVNGIRDIDFASTTLGFAAGYAGSSLKKTIDGGSSWTPLTPPTSNALWGVSVVNANTIFVSGTGKVVWKSTNGGNSFSVVNLPAGPSDLVVDLDFVSTTNGCALGQYGGVWRTTNGGTSWTNTYTTTGIEYVSIYFVDAMTGFVVGEAGTILKTTNGGASWSPLVSGSSARLQYVHFLDLNNGIVAGYDGTILRTINGGTTWFMENTGTSEKLRCCYLISPTIAIAGGDNGLMMKNANLTTGVEDLNTLSDCKIYPNPTKGLFLVKSEEAFKNLKVFDSMGRLVWESREEAFEAQIDLSSCSPGVYYAKIEAPGVVRTFKIIRDSH